MYEQIHVNGYSLGIVRFNDWLYIALRVKKHSNGLGYGGLTAVSSGHSNRTLTLAQVCCSDPGNLYIRMKRPNCSEYKSLWDHCSPYQVSHDSRTIGG
jgi:hypothetical protein